MKLSDLNPKLEGNVESGMLRFDCPLGHPHKMRVPLGTQGIAIGWKAEGEYPDTLTLSPSIHAHSGIPSNEELTDEAYEHAAECGWHGWIRNGEIVNA